MTIDINGELDVGSATFNGADGYAYNLNSTGDLVIQGTVSIVSTVVNDTNMLGIYAWNYSSSIPTLEIAVGGSLDITSSGSGSTARGLYSNGANFTNHGIFEVQANTAATGVSLYGAATFTNTGSFTVLGGSSVAPGVNAAVGLEAVRD